jgi:ABC-2 type transport system permease protein
MSFTYLSSNAKKNLSVLRSAATAEYKTWAAYRSIIAITIFVAPANFLVQYFIWHAVYSPGQLINGLTLNQMLEYYGICAIIIALIWDGAHDEMSEHIQNGTFITFMLRPYSYLNYALGQKIGHRALAFIMEFSPIYIILALAFKILLIPALPLWALLSIILSFFLSFMINICIGTIGFWTTKTNGLSRAISLFKDLCAGSFIPLVFLPMAAQKILFFLPFQFISYVPIRVFLGSYELAGITLSIPFIVGLQALMLVVVILLYRVLWHFGIKRFTGVGA